MMRKSSAITSNKNGNNTILLLIENLNFFNREMLSKPRRPAWTDEQLQAALSDLRTGRAKSVRGAALLYGIPHSTLDDHYTGKATKRFGGPSTVLAYSVEKEIATSCMVLQEFGFPVTKEMVTALIRDYLKETGQPNPFTNDTPGRAWWRGFFKRWPAIVERKPQHLPKSRAMAANSEVRKQKKLSSFQLVLMQTGNGQLV